MDKVLLNKAITLLDTSLMENLATLKYLTLYRENAGVKILEDKTGWAVLSFFPTALLSFDKRAYPQAKVAVFVNGNSLPLQHQLLASLPANYYILRLNQILETERRKGYGHIVVYSALKYLLEQGLKPRYVTEEQNTSSIKLAESLGMKPFLKLEHFLLAP